MTTELIHCYIYVKIKVKQKLFFIHYPVTMKMTSGFCKNWLSGRKTKLSTKYRRKYYPVVQLILMNTSVITSIKTMRTLTASECQFSYTCLIRCYGLDINTVRARR